MWHSKVEISMNSKNSRFSPFGGSCTPEHPSGFEALDLFPPILSAILTGHELKASKGRRVQVG